MGNFAVSSMEAVGGSDGSSSDGVVGDGTRVVAKQLSEVLQFDGLMSAVVILLLLGSVSYFASFCILDRWRRKARQPQGRGRRCSSVGPGSWRVAGAGGQGEDGEEEEEADLLSVTEVEEVDRWSLPFQLCCLCLACSFATAVAVPVTTIAFTQLDSESASAEAAQLLVHMMWAISVRGSNLCLFVLLPFAYFYKEATWGNEGRRKPGTSRWRPLFGRMCSSLVEVSLLGAMLSGIFYLLQLVLIDGGEVQWKYPSTIVSTCQMLPGLVVFVVSTPLGMRKLVSMGSRYRANMSVRPSQLDVQIDSERFEISALKRRLEAMQPVGGGSATSSSFAVRQRHPWRSSEVVGEEARWRRSEQPRLRRPTIGAGGSGGGGIRGDGETVEQLRSKLAKQEAELAANTARQSRRSKRLRWLLWPLKCAYGWGAFAVPLTMSGAVLAKAVMRPFLVIADTSGFLFDFRPWYNKLFGISISTAAAVGCAVDTLFVAFFIIASVLGVYFGNSFTWLSLSSIRPKPHATSMGIIIANVVVMQLLSFALPATAWMVGLGAFDVMKVVSSHYGHIELLRSTVFVTLYNALFVCVAAWLVFIRAKAKLFTSGSGSTKATTAAQAAEYVPTSTTTAAATAETLSPQDPPAHSESISNAANGPEVEVPSR